MRLTEEQIARKANAVRLDPRFAAADSREDVGDVWEELQEAYDYETAMRIWYAAVRMVS